MKTILDFDELKYHKDRVELIAHQMSDGGYMGTADFLRESLTAITSHYESVIKNLASDFKDGKSPANWIDILKAKYRKIEELECRILDCEKAMGDVQ
jgi:hypothetical protein